MNIRSWFCNHDYVRIAATYAPGITIAEVDALRRSGPVWSDQVERMLKDKTSFVFQCCKCNDIKSFLLDGKEIERKPELKLISTAERGPFKGDRS